MPHRSSKSRDYQQIARRTLDAVVPDAEPPKKAGKAKDPAAVSLGKRGGLKGGPARAKKLSTKRRKEIAQKAAAKRWSSRSR